MNADGPSRNQDQVRVRSTREQGGREMRAQRGQRVSDGETG